MVYLGKVPEKREEITLQWLNQIFKPHRIEVKEFSFTGATGQGRGAMSALETMELQTVRLDNANSNNFSETLNIVLKTMAKDEAMRSFGANDGFYTREISMYTEVFKVYDDFYNTHNVPIKNRYRHPVCYYGAEEGEGETYKFILVLENLTNPREGFDFHLWAPGLSTPLPWQVTTAVIRQIARLHATGVAYKIHNNVKAYTQLFPKLNHRISAATDYVWEKGFEATKDIIKESISDHELPEGLFQQIEKLQCDDGKNLLMKWFLQPEDMFSQNDVTTICHHDLHCNNLVLSGDQTEAILFDYQACCVFNPMKDLTFFMVLNCEAGNSQETLDKVFQLYHEEFHALMAATKTNFEYSLESMKKDYERNFAFSLSHLMTGVHFWFLGRDCTAESRKRFSLAIIDAYKKGILCFPLPEVEPSIE